MTQENYSAAEIVEGISSKKFPIDDVVKYFHDRTEKHRKNLNTHLYYDLAWVKAQASQLKPDSKKPLLGVPILIKDNICTKGIPTTCSSKILKGYVPPYDATVIKKLQNAGAIIFGKTNCDEFAMGSSNENSAFGPVKNPWDLTRVPGGSSGGSAAAVAADLAPVSLGSDTGGSIRQPASLCGLVGVKPTYGRVSRYGLIAYGSSLDQIGPFSRTVKDAAMVLDVISGHDPLDSTSENLPSTKCVEALKNPISLKGKKIGIVKEFFEKGLDPEVRKVLESALEEYKKLGAELVDISIPSLPYSIAIYYVVATAEASANLSRFDGIRYGLRVQTPKSSLKDIYRDSRGEGFGKEVKQRIMLGAFALSSGYYDAFYGKATNACAIMKREFAEAFKKVDVLMSPTSPTTAFKLGEKASDPLAMYLSDICTIAVNLTGIPGMSIPCGFDSKGLPVGLQLMADHFQEEKMFQFAYQYEQATKWYEKKPNI